MADLAILLLRTVSRAFYTTEHSLVIDALIVHSTLPDYDLAHLLGIQPKSLRKICGRLKEDGLLTVQQRAERRTDGQQSFWGGGSTQAQTGPNGTKERVTHRDWYYLNFHRAIDSIKYRMYKLNKHVESLGAPTTEKKDLSCPRCKSQYTELEVLDRIDVATGAFLCRRCGHELDIVEEDDRANENESMKRLNSQLEKILRLMQQIDATTVPENDFQTALSRQKPVVRSDVNPGQMARTEVVDLPNRNLASTKGLDIKPEKIAVHVQDDESVKLESAAEEERARREKEARQNALPDWIAKSTVSGDITAVGAKEERLRKEREGNAATASSSSLLPTWESEDSKPLKDGGEEGLTAAFWEQLAKAQAEEAARAKASEDDDEEEEEDDEDEFEDVDVGVKPRPDGTVANGVNGGTSGTQTPAVESSNATDDEREAKRTKVDDVNGGSSSQNATNGVAAVNAVAEQAAADESRAASDEDEDEMEFEDV